MPVSFSTIRFNSSTTGMGRSFAHANASGGAKLPRAGRTYLVAGGTTFMTNEVGVSLGPNGPGALWLTGGTLRR